MIRAKNCEKLPKFVKLRPTYYGSLFSGHSVDIIVSDSLHMMQLKIHIVLSRSILYISHLYCFKNKKVNYNYCSAKVLMVIFMLYVMVVRITM